MTLRSRWLAAIVATTTTLAAGSALGQAKSLNKCQAVVGVQGNKYARAVADTVGKCLAQVSTAVIKDGGVPGDAATQCAKQLVKLVNSAAPTKTLSAKLNTALGKACDPSVNPNLLHAESDIYTIGGATLGAANLNAQCLAFGGDGTIASFNEWRDCIRAAADCRARQAIAVQWPRALEYIESLLAAPEITGNADAMAALSAVDTAIEGATDDNRPELVCGEPPAGTCGDNSINVAGEQCDASNLGGESCTSLGFTGGTLTCTGCSFDTSSCISGSGCVGTATAADVRTGATFSNSSMIGLNGSMPILPYVAAGTTNQPIPQGYWDGEGPYCGDTNLESSRVRSGVNIFGVVGDPEVVNTSSGNVTSPDLLQGKTCWSDGVAVGGGITNVGQQNITPATANQTINSGYHDGTGACAGDADLIASNIISGANLFGVAGTAQPTARALRTGQTLCFDASGSTITCTGTGQDGALQLDVARQYTFDTTVPSQRTVIDAGTGLEWEVLCTAVSPVTCPTDHDMETTYNWAAAFTKISNMNAASYAGHNDWRLPNINELRSLVNYGTSSPAIQTAAFNTGPCIGCSTSTCTCTASDSYWTSTSLDLIMTQAWLVDFTDGHVAYTGKFNTAYARAVRGGL